MSSERHNPLTLPSPPRGEGNKLLALTNLRVSFRTNDGVVEAVKGIDLSIARNEVVAIVGESGSGKSQTMMALMGLLASNGYATGEVAFDGGAPADVATEPLKPYRGNAITMIFQEPMTSLDPLYRIGRQMTLVIERHQKLSSSEAVKRAIELLKLVRIPNAEGRMDAYPHELSGGQRQRVMIAMALANNPKLLIADEPTTALDVTIQAEILRLMKELQAKFGMAIAFISHDLNVVKRFADRVYVMRYGEVVETGAVADVFRDPQHAYTKMLIAAEPTGRKVPPAEDAPILLSGENIRVAFAMPKKLFAPRPAPLIAVDGVSLKVPMGGTLGIVGESGSGKSTLGRALLKLNQGDGRIAFNGQRIDGLSRDALRPLRRDMQVVFQDPFGSLSPRMTVGEIITEGLLVHEPQLSRAERDRRAAEALVEVSLDAKMRNRYPHEFSGGQRQRIAIARAMILKPKLMLLDEPTSALDRTVQKSVVELLRDLQAKHSLTYLFISHDLAVVRALSDQVLVMKDGRIVEEGDVDAIFARPREEYTKALIAAAFPDQI
ncbi:MAG: ABC transporter ATP-binding protein [Beijerinckiaceae bacterium]